MIAEAGSCHDGDLSFAIELVLLAAEAGADAVKFQYWSSGKALASRRRAEAYTTVYERYAMPATWLPRLSGVAGLRGLEYMTTAYLPEDIAVVAPHVTRFKIASFEARDREFIDAHRAYNKPCVISLGMLSTADVLGIPFAPHDIALQCVSSYPCPSDEAALGAIAYLDGLLPCAVGYSDHTRRLSTGALAVAAGARAVEVHFRLRRTAPDNPDAAVALTPRELKRYITWIRHAERVLGARHKVVMPCERAMQAFQR